MPSLWWWAASLFPGVPCPPDRPLGRPSAPRANPSAASLRGKSEAQLRPLLARARERQAAALAGWRSSKSKAENDAWKRKTRAADLDVERVENAIRVLPYARPRSERVPAGPLSQLRLFNPRAPRRAGRRAGRR